MADGKGFDLGAMLAGLTDVSDLDTNREQITYISLTLIDSDPNNFYQLSGIEDLAANIATCGLQQPIRVRKHPEAEGRYMIVSGHRRRAALELLYEDDPERWADIPCIVESDSISPALQQLRLIYANSNTRTLTSPELNEQAVQVEKLLYQLKEEGYEFPGRMRDHVAQAVGASQTKLARLKVIDDKLDNVWSLSYKTGKLNESSAYALAKLPVSWQRIIYYGIKDESMGGVCSISAVTVDNYREVFEKIKDIECPVDGGFCSHRSAMMEKSVRVSYLWNACKGCCLDCDNLNHCGSSCFHADKKKRSLNQKHKAEIKQEKEAARVEENSSIDIIQATYERARSARELNGVDAKKVLSVAGISPVMEKYYSDFENGKNVIVKTSPLAYLNEVSTKAAKQLLAVSSALGCSIDWLLGRDVPGPGKKQTAPESGPQPAAGWRTGDPEEPGEYAVLTSNEVGGRLFCDICGWDGARWSGLFSDEIVRYWMPMPEVEHD